MQREPDGPALQLALVDGEDELESAPAGACVDVRLPVMDDGVDDVGEE